MMPFAYVDDGVVTHEFKLTDSSDEFGSDRR